jgi:hypothetical protein
MRLWWPERRGWCLRRARAHCGVQYWLAQHSQLRQVTSFIHQLARHGERTPKVTYATTPTRDFIYFIKKEDHPYRAFFRRFVSRLLYLDTSWGGCSGFVDYIIGLFALRFLRSGRSLLFCILSLSFSFRLQ